MTSPRYNLTQLPPHLQRQAIAQLHRDGSLTVTVTTPQTATKAGNKRLPKTVKGLNGADKAAMVAQIWASAGIRKPVAEYRFHPTRKWRFDYAWPECKVALECDGGVFSGGRHTRGAGFLKDIEKFNAAACLGWRMLRCTPQQLTAGETIQTIRAALGYGRAA